MGHSSQLSNDVIWLDGRTVDRAIAGGKGASLSRLAGFGAAVPPSFALTTAAYQTAAKANDLPVRAKQVRDADLPQIRCAIESTPLPVYLRNLIASAYDRLSIGLLDDASVAVRSSATAEDSAEHSFAGLHDTVLEVEGVASLEAAVKRCWASLWTERAVSYRRLVERDDEISSIAVVVQRMIRSDVSFVVFTSDPITGRSDQLVINATWGLGEALVSGLVTPDQIVVDRAGRVRDYTVGEKAVMIVPGGPGEGTREMAVPRLLRTMRALDDEQIRGIASMSRRLAERFGHAADLEGGISGGEIYFLQARPITTIPA